MKTRIKRNVISCLCLTLLIVSCRTESPNADKNPSSVYLPSNVLDYKGTPSSPEDRSSLAFSDQGAWFAYGFPGEAHKTLGFSGPLLMTQGQGEWSSKALSKLEIFKSSSQEKLDVNTFSLSRTSFNSHLEQRFENQELKIEQHLFFHSPHSAIITTHLSNISNKPIALQAKWTGTIFPIGIQITKEENRILLKSDRSVAKGMIQTFDHDIDKVTTTDSSYSISLKEIKLKADESTTLKMAHTFIFPEYDTKVEQEELVLAAKTPLQQLEKRKKEKTEQLSILYHQLDSNWQDPVYQDLVAKTVLTLQNNTRIPVGELKHMGLFPSYHYKWFLGFWAWDSWKHAAAIAHYNTELAKSQIKAMYDFQQENGFILDCVFRDTSIENHNYRNTKPPLSAWAVWTVYEQGGDVDFVKEMYPKIVKQHEWWYQYRDYDQDGICEYGSTDGTLVAAKWESGMDNAVRFDSSEMVKSAKTVYSLNQESVDLNSYLYAEKRYLAKMATVIHQPKDAEVFTNQAEALKTNIQNQFYEENTAWFYDTSIDGEQFIEVMGCEGWIPLWAGVATDEQAEAVKNNMMKPDLFYTKVPFQTLSASHPRFHPDGGYWRGPNWLDQAYFGVKGLQNYGFQEEAYQASYKLIHNAEGVLGKGTSIRENYQPVTGAGLESKNFSWSAGHYLLLLLKE